MTTECQQLQYRPSSLKVKISIDKPDKKGAPPYVDPRQRLVWLLARPLPGIRSITSVAAGGFPILHWAVLLSPRGYEKKRMKSLLETLQRWPRDLQHFHMGTIQEIRFDQTSGKTIRRFGELTTWDFLQEFQRSSIAYVGLSCCTDEEINNYGITLFGNEL